MKATTKLTNMKSIIKIRYNFDKFRLNFPQLLNVIATGYNLLLWKLSGNPHTSQTPLVLMVEPTNRCNFNCPLCDKGSGNLSRAEGIMKLDDFVKILDEAGRGLKLLLLWNQGEPFINKRLTEFINIASRRGIFCIVSTNGSLIAKNLEGIIESGLDELIVSLDGATEATFNMYRKGGDFNRIVDSVEKLVKLRGERNKPLISLQFLLLKHNIKEIASFKELADKTCADRVLWKTVQVSETAQAEEYLPEAAEFRRYKDGKGIKVNKTYQGCRRLLYSAVIDWNGNMVPCCFDKDESFVMGNVLRDGFKRCWTGEEFSSLRREISSGKMPDMCSNCTEGLKKLFIS